jgi:hypothetical protein
MNKKIISFFVAIFFIFSNFTYVLAADDLTPPVITGMTWAATELHVGDKLDIEIDASDIESGISTGSYDTSIFIRHNVTFASKSALLVYDDAAQKLKGSITISSDMASGEWVFDFVSIKDEAGNRKFFRQSDFTQQYKLNVIGASSDITPPLITGMTWSAAELHIGDKLDIEIDASDTESGISTGNYDTSIFIRHNVTFQSKSALLVYDDTTQKLKGSITISSDMASGEWIFDFVSVKDKANNRKFYRQSDFTQQYKLNVIGASSDITPPLITGMTWSAAELQVGDNLNIEIDASDTESGISTGDYDTSIFIRHNVTFASKSALLVYDDTTKKLKGSIAISSDMASGEWMLDFVSIKDKANNRKFYRQSDFTQQYKFNTKSVFSGTENVSISVGTNFNPLSGVKAVSSWEGDFTYKITCTGIVDSSTEGVYLIKYEAVGKNGDIYRNYRWISVVNNPAYDEHGKMIGTYFSKGIALNFSKFIDLNLVKITRNGNIYVTGQDGSITEEGKYVLSVNSTISQVNQLESLINTYSNVASDDSAGVQPSEFEFTIDKTSPQIVESCPQTIDEGMQISADKFVKALDDSIVTYEYLGDPLWTNIGQQNIQIVAKDLAGNQVTQEVGLTIIDKCDIDKDGNVNIIDLASVAQKYNHKNTQVNWDLRFDFNKDNIVDIFDLVISSKKMIVN